MTEQDALIGEFLLPLQLAGIDCDHAVVYGNSPRGGNFCKIKIKIGLEYLYVDLDNNTVSGVHFMDDHHMLYLVAVAFGRGWDYYTFVYEYFKAHENAYLERNM